MTVQITILGLGQVGASIGLALAGKKDAILRVGNDREPNVVKQAQKMGAVDQTHFNLPSSVSKADIVLLCMPVDEIKTTLEAIAGDLREGCVVIDTSPIKQGVAGWAGQLLPKDRHYVAMTPALNPAYLSEAAVGIDAAHADLFKNSLMVITHAPGADADALKLTADLATLVGGTPLFADPYEIDGLMAAVHLLPQLLAATLVEVTVKQPGWNEARRVAGRAYTQATLPLLEPTESQFYGQGALLNKENTLRMLDTTIASLRELRQEIADEDEKALAGRLKAAIEARILWQVQREKSDWDLAPAPPLPTAGEIMGRLFGLGRKPKKQ